MVWVLVQARDWLFATRVISVSVPFEFAVVCAPDIGKATGRIIEGDGTVFPLRTPVRWLRMAALQLLAGRSFWAEMELGPPWIMI